MEHIVKTQKIAVIMQDRAVCVDPKYDVSIQEGLETQDESTRRGFALIHE